jgi:hypothetical protein
MRRHGGLPEEPVWQSAARAAEADRKVLSNADLGSFLCGKGGLGWGGRGESVSF